MKNLHLKALTLYTDIDLAVENHYKGRKKRPPCAKGCSSCCSQFFEISELEFELIFEVIAQWTASQKKELSKNAEIIFTAFKENWSDFYDAYFSPETLALNTNDYYNHPQRFEVSLPCIFLSSEGSCQIYDRRPNVCRTTGVGFQHLINTGAVCDYIKSGITTPFWQADLRPFKVPIEELRWLEDALNPDMYKRQYPMFYYVYACKDL